MKNKKRMIMFNMPDAMRFCVVIIIAESGSRIGEFTRGQKAELKKGATDKEAIQAAAMASREVTLDFAKKGAATKSANMLIAFFQAQINGTDKMIRAFKDNPVGTTMRTMAAITLPSILLTIANRDDPRWKDIPQWQKDLFWIVLTEDHIWRIPKPFELGIIFGTVPERITEYILDKDPHAFDHLLDTIARGAAPGIVPTAALPWIENWANQSLFLDRPIVPQSMEDVLPEYQYKPYTTETAKAMGKILGKLPVVSDMVSPSPAKIENLVRGWTGGVGMYALQLSDWALEKAGITKKSYEEPTKTLADIPFVRAFVVRYPTANAEGIQEFYENYEQADRIRNTVQMLIQRENDFDTALGLMQEGQLERLDSFHEAIRNTHKMVNQIYIDPVMTGDEKREFIDIVYMQMCGIAREGNKIFRQLDEAMKEKEK